MIPLTNTVRDSLLWCSFSFSIGPQQIQRSDYSARSLSSLKCQLFRCILVNHCSSEASLKKLDFECASSTCKLDDFISVFAEYFLYHANLEQQAMALLSKTLYQSVLGSFGFFSVPLQILLFPLHGYFLFYSSFHVSVHPFSFSLRSPAHVCVRMCVRVGGWVYMCVCMSMNVCVCVCFYFFFFLRVLSPFTKHPIWMSFRYLEHPLSATCRP